MKDEAGTAKENEADEAAGTIEAVGPAGESPELPVEAFDLAVAQADGNEGEDAFQVTADGSIELLERREPLASGPPAPMDEILSGDVDPAGG